MKPGPLLRLDSDPVWADSDLVAVEVTAEGWAKARFEDGTVRLYPPHRVRKIVRPPD